MICPPTEDNAVSVCAADVNSDAVHLVHCRGNHLFCVRACSTCTTGNFDAYLVWARLLLKYDIIEPEIFWCRDPKLGPESCLFRCGCGETQWERQLIVGTDSPARVCSARLATLWQSPKWLSRWVVPFAACKGREGSIFATHPTQCQFGMLPATESHLGNGCIPLSTSTPTQLDP